MRTIFFYQIPEYLGVTYGNYIKFIINFGLKPLPDTRFK